MSEHNPFDAPWSHARRHGPVLAPALISGLIAVVMVAMRTPLVAWLRGFLSELPQPRKTGGTELLDRGLPIDLIRDAILGRGKSAVAAVFGAPRTAANQRRSPRPDFWSADTWYYPIDTQHQTAMAVRFDRGIARHVDFFRTPLPQKP